MLKKACRARNNETIVPNIFSPPGKIVPASAFLEWRADGKQESARWTDGTTSPAPLSRIAVFDSLCARVFVDDQAEVSYVPFGMDVLKILASAMQDAQKLVDTERARTQLDRTKFAALAGTHSVGRMISGLSRKTDVKQVTELAVLTDDEQTELSALIKQLREEELTSRLTSELAELGLSNVKIGLELAGQRGMRVQKLKLSASSQFAKVKLSDVLSEGEQRAIALAAFLAEIGVEPGKSGIIFDDPVSSLDHVRRERIADRLAREGKERQVIVFTHDLAFAWSLRESAERFGVKHAERHVYAAG